MVHSTWQFLDESNFKQCIKDPCAFIHRNGNTKLSLSSYVDDLTIITNNETKRRWIKAQLLDEFEKIHDLGPLRHVLGMDVERNQNQLRMHQTRYIDKMLKRFNLTNCRTRPFPMQTNLNLNSVPDEGVKETKFPVREALGALLYLAICTRPDIAYAVFTLARYQANPDQRHEKAIKGIFKYLQLTRALGLTYNKGYQEDLSATPFFGVSDANYVKGDRCRSGFPF